MIRPDVAVLGIVPARGGSKGLRGKNMLSLGGRPLMAHTLHAASNSGIVDRLIISSDSDEVLRWADVHGYETLRRPDELANDVATVSDVARHAVLALDWHGFVLVLQPTSPLRSAESIRRAYQAFVDSNADSLSSVSRESHLFWYEPPEGGVTQPLFQERVNRQYAKHAVLRETGAIQFVKSDCLRSLGDMVTPQHVLHELPEHESLDIDSVDDFRTAQRQFEAGHIVFRLRSNTVVGSGHLYRCLHLSEVLQDHRTTFLLTADSSHFAERILARTGCEVLRETNLAADLEKLRTDGVRRVLVNDVLDTSEPESLIPRLLGFGVVCIEDLGKGAELAHVVVNSLYGHSASLDALVGPRYSVLRSEFHDLPPKENRETGQRVLLTFGGTDPAELSLRFARVLAEQRPPFEIAVLLGPGYAGKLEDFPPGLDVKTDVRSVAAEMMRADVILTSAGRTVYEAAATGTPVVVLAQNAREATHAHLAYESGVIFLGIGDLVEDSQVVEVLDRLLAKPALRRELSHRLKSGIDHRGVDRIADQIRILLREGMDHE